MDTAEANSPYPLSTLLYSTRDQQVLLAFQQLSISDEGRPALELIINKRARVFFKNLGEISKNVKDYDALSWISPKGEWVIFINKSHKSAPPQAIATIIAHEAIHNDPENSLNEEIVGWYQEARVWLEMNSRYPELSQLPAPEGSLIHRLNNIAQHYQSGTLNYFVRSNPGYANLPETSNGFTHLQTRLHSPYEPVYTEALKPL